MNKRFVVKGKVVYTTVGLVLCVATTEQAAKMIAGALEFNENPRLYGYKLVD